ncbi:hypothetical protein DMA15_26320 [Streptomyces sp. WAC 01529]|nr:hypothetical protein DMA15_26320 [Streptomyces sp. WAC 01529]
MTQLKRSQRPKHWRGRILRYWGGNLRHYALTPGDGESVHDSAYREVGRWRVVAGSGGGA